MSEKPLPFQYQFAQWTQFKTIDQIIAAYRRRTERENRPQHILDEA